MLERLFPRSRRFPQAVLPLALAVGALCYSSVSSALGLGELSLRSYLNQPFKADIDLTDTAGLDADDISAGIATPDAYARAGIDRLFFLNDLHFTPDFSGGRKVIHVTSTKALTEPYLTFLVEVNRPAGQLLRAYTVLLDPPGTVALAPPLPVPASKPQARAAAPRVAKAPVAERAAAAPTPPAPAKAPAVDPQVQKSLDELRLRLQTLQSEVDVKNSQVATLETQLAQAKALPAAAVVPAPMATNPAPAAVTAAPAAPSAVTPTAPAPTTPAATATPTPATVTPATATPAPAPVIKPTAVAPVATVPAPVSEEDNSWYLMLGVAALLLLLVALLLVVRRNRQRSVPILVSPLEDEDPASALVKPAQVSEAQVAAPVVRSLAQQEPVAASRRETATATDALDGASIYIAYGRFNEALGILREGVIKQPDRTDLRLRILEVLGQQGDLAGFEQEEAEMLAIGFSAEKIQQVRQQSPKLAQAAKAMPAPSVEAAATVAAVAGIAAAAVVEAQVEVKASPIAPPPPEPEPAITSLHSASVAEPDFDFDLESLGGEDLPLLDDNPLDEPAPEFQLNLDDLSMEADWEAVSPFEPTPVVRKATPSAPPAELDLDEPLEVDPIFNTNLRELPEVYEMPEEQFLSDFADLDEPLLESEPLKEHDLSQSQDDIDNDFLNSFGADSDFELDSLSVDFDSVESQQASAEKLEQAQSLIEIGDTEGASNLLHELLRDGDDSCKASARVLLGNL